MQYSRAFVLSAVTAALLALILASQAAQAYAELYVSNQVMASLSGARGSDGGGNAPRRVAARYRFYSGPTQRYTAISNDTSEQASRKARRHRPSSLEALPVRIATLTAMLKFHLAPSSFTFSTVSPPAEESIVERKLAARGRTGDSLISLGVEVRRATSQCDLAELVWERLCADPGFICQAASDVEG